VRILHVINSLATGGAEKLLLETLPRYNEQGLKADLLVLNGTSHPFLEELKKQNCCEIFVLGNSSPYQLKFIFKLIPFFKQYDLVHTHLFPANYFVALAKIISFSKTPLVFTEHNTSNRRFRNKYFNWVNKHIYKIFTAVICITNEVRNVVANNTELSSEKLMIIENGVDIKNFADAVPLPRNQIANSLNEDDFILIQVSSFRDQKDHRTAINALIELPANIKLLLAGEGPLRSDYEELVRTQSLQKRVLFLGNRIDIPNLLKSCDASILSSNYEGFGLVAVEGMAAGKPFIASNVSGLREIVENYGLLFEKGNAKELSKIIFALKDDSLLYEEVASRCLKRAEDFTIDVMIQKHIQVYKKIYNENK
jgi:glycosyltransferase involved in cell wall biosynthesis